MFDSTAARKPKRMQRKRILAVSVNQFEFLIKTYALQSF